MRYFHRTQLSPDAVLAEADRHFGSHLEEIERGERARRYNGSLGTVGVAVLPEGGHYVHITVQTDQVGESHSAEQEARRRAEQGMGHAPSLDDAARRPSGFGSEAAHG